MIFHNNTQVPNCQIIGMHEVRVGRGAVGPYLISPALCVCIHIKEELLQKADGVF